MENISEHISYKEAIRSTVASMYGIDNTPNPDQLRAMKMVARCIFEPVRNHFKVPIFISSFFRSLLLNSHPKVRGSKTSGHLTGEALDLDDVLGGVTNAQIFHFIKDNLDFDQLIWEFQDPNNPNSPAWVHASYKSKEKNRRQVLRAIRFTDRGGKLRTKYVPYT